MTDDTWIVIARWRPIYDLQVRRHVHGAEHLQHPSLTQPTTSGTKKITDLVQQGG